jgi:hypothetical protein
MKIEFNEKKEITIRPAKTEIVPEKIINTPAIKRLVNEITILSMLDEPTFKKVTVRTKEVGSLVIWEGDAYDAIGQWTDQDVTDRILEIVNNI